MEKIYLFGAFINCLNIIDFLGKENIVDIIDNDPGRYGKEWGGLNVIPLEEYVRRNDNRRILVTGYMRAEEIVAQLIERGIYNYQKCPWMQTYFASADEVIDKLSLQGKSKIAFYNCNPIAEKIAETIISKDPSVEIIYINGTEKLPDFVPQIPVLLTIPEDDAVKDILKNKYGQNWCLDLDEIYKTQYRFKNPALKRFKGIHAGKRCFVIGNGPSLTMEDLNLLYEKKEICFAGNAIYRAYRDTQWRPTYYVSVDRQFLDIFHEEIDKLNNICFVNHFNGQGYEWKGENIFEFGRLPNKAENLCFSYDIVEGVYIGSTLVYDAIQIALYMGFKEIYLLGVDASNVGKEEPVHFYGANDKKISNCFGINTMSMRNSIGAAGRAVSKAGGVLKNATRGGELVEIERVNFDSLF